MRATDNAEDIAAQIHRLLDEGPMLPGTINPQWTVCGRKGCRCADPDAPRRHGPYHQLSFCLGGKSSSMFVKAKDLGAATECTRRYHRFRALSAQLFKAHVAAVRREGFPAGSVAAAEA